MSQKKPEAWYRKTWVIVAGILITLLIIGAAGGSDKKDTKSKAEPIAQAQQKDESLAPKVKAALDKLDEGTKSALASSPNGYQGTIVGVEPAVGNDTVKVKVSTYFKDTGDGPDGGQGIARRIYGMVCLDVPELDSLYVVSSSGLESKSVYRSDIPACKQ